MAQIEKSYGKGSVMRLGDEARQPISVIPTGSIALDVALGIGGLPRGRVIEIYGPESSGKTTVALHAVANAQAAGGVAAFIDAEHALDPDYAKKLGVDTDSLLVSQPDTGEQALEIADMLIRSGALDIVVIDSVAALVPRAELEGEMGDSHVGLQARLMSQALRKMTGALNNSGTTAIFINQLRDKIGVMFGSPETTTGGKALKFYASVRMDVRRVETLKDGTNAVGNRTRVKVVKNKCPQRALGSSIRSPVQRIASRMLSMGASLFMSWLLPRTERCMRGPWCPGSTRNAGCDRVADRRWRHRVGDTRSQGADRVRLACRRGTPQGRQGGATATLRWIR